MWVASVPARFGEQPTPPQPFKATSPKPEEIAATFAEIKRRFGKLDILVNNAGI
jgi:NAD(P)-dependent dehydrogenase (short-subunit alcohol dehydrogenase family)